MKGVFTALITPFLKDGSIDYGSLKKLVDQQVRAKVDGIVICGTTGESPTLKKEEKMKLFSEVATLLQGTSVELIAGTGSNDTAETISLTQEVEKLGVKKFLIVTPYYNKPSQTGMIEHFTKIASSIRGEIILYNVPGRTGIGLTSETIAKLAAHPRIVALKEASGQVRFATEIVTEVAKSGHRLSLLSGDDETYFPLLCVGATGVISVASHLVPGPMKKILEYVESGNVAKARELHDHCFPVFRDLFIESNPSPVKWAMAKLGLCENHLRLPLSPVSEASAKKLEAMMALYRVKDGALE